MGDFPCAPLIRDETSYSSIEPQDGVDLLATRFSSKFNDPAEAAAGVGQGRTGIQRKNSRADGHLVCSRDVAVRRAVT